MSYPSSGPESMPWRRRQLESVSPAARSVRPVADGDHALDPEAPRRIAVYSYVLFLAGLTLAISPFYAWETVTDAGTVSHIGAGTPQYALCAMGLIIALTVSVAVTLDRLPAYGPLFFTSVVALAMSIVVANHRDQQALGMLNALNNGSCPCPGSSIIPGSSLVFTVGAASLALLVSTIGGLDSFSVGSSAPTAGDRMVDETRRPVPRGAVRRALDRTQGTATTDDPEDQPPNSSSNA